MMSKCQLFYMKGDREKDHVRVETDLFNECTIYIIVSPGIEPGYIVFPSNE
jgi:hypothetical protein